MKMRNYFLIIMMTLTSPVVWCADGIGVAVAFIENVGQWDATVRFEAQLSDAALFVEDDGWTVALRAATPHPSPYSAEVPQLHAYKLSFAGANPTKPQGEGKHQGYSNYFIGNDKSKWRSKVSSYSVVRYTNLYDGIDVELYTASKAAKYNIIAQPWSDVGNIMMTLQGVDDVRVNRKGDLVISTSVRDIIERRPYAYQGNRQIDAHWKVSTKGDLFYISFDIGEYDHSQSLIIDPELIFSTYSGSMADNWGTTAAYDSKKCTYTAGLVFSIGYPASLGAYDISYNGGVDIGIFKFDTSGSSRLWATYLGGDAADLPHSMFVNSLDELLIFGTTGSADFPTTIGAYQTSHAGGQIIDYESSTIRFTNGSDIFVCRFNSDGSQLGASTLIGGSGNDGLNYRQRYNNNTIVMMAGNDSLYHNYGDGARGEIITDDMGNVYVGSTTMSYDFPTTTGCVSPSNAGKQDGIVFKLDYNLKNLLWSTYIGGNQDDAVFSVDVDSSYNVVICGGTSSTNFPITTDSYQTTYGGGSADGFVCKISANGNSLMSSSYIGHIYYDQVYFVRTGRHDEVFLFGQTEAIGNTMVYNAGYSVYGAGMLLMRLTPDLSERVWSTVFGTSGRINLSPTAFAADICNRIYAAGWGRDFVGYNGVQWYSAGTSGMEVSPNAYQNNTDGQDFYIISLDADANNMEYATFFGELHQTGQYGGGDHVDGGTSRFDRLATLYQSVCASCGGTQDFPLTANAWSDNNPSVNCNNALFRFNVTNDFPVAEFNAPPVGCAPYTIQLNNTGRGQSYLWDFGDGTTSTLANPTHTYSSAGNYVITLIANMPSGCATSDTQRHSVLVLDGTSHSHTPGIACNNDGLQIGLTPSLGATYSWSGDPVSDNTVANPWVYNTGVYILHTQADGCSQTDTFHVENYSLIDSLFKTSNSCHDSTDAQAIFRLGAGISPDSITVTILPTASISQPTLTASRYWITISSLAPDVTYHLTVSGYGCSYDEYFSIPNKPKPQYRKEAKTILCTDACDGIIKIIYDESVVPEVPPRDTTLSNLCEGVYVTELTSMGCPFSDTTVITRQHALDNLRAWADMDKIYIGESVGLHATTDDSAIPVTFEWSPSTDLDKPYSANPIATPTDSLSCYTVTASTSSCQAEATVCVRCDEVLCGEPQFSIPNAFTPNGDGVNDKVCFYSEEFTYFYIAFFNRWGEKVFETYDPTDCWDGTYRNNPCLPGVYTYTCHIRCHAGKERDLKGDITLLR